jgi:hypothetical protein
MRIIAVVAILSAASVHADPPRYKRASAVPPAPTKVEKRTAEPAQPTVTSADAILAGEERAQPIRKEQELTLQKLACDTPDTDPDKPELLFRLAELFAQQSRFWRLKAH